MLHDLLTKPVWKKPEEGEHTAVLKNWIVKEFTSKSDPEDKRDYIACTFVLDNKREIIKNLFEQDVRILSSALVNNNIFSEGTTLVDMLNAWRDKTLEIKCWIKYNKTETDEYMNFYWYEPKEEVVEEIASTISLGNVSKEDLAKMESLPL